MKLYIVALLITFFTHFILSQNTFVNHYKVQGDALSVKVSGYTGVEQLGETEEEKLIYRMHVELKENRTEITILINPSHNYNNQFCFIYDTLNRLLEHRWKYNRDGIPNVQTFIYNKNGEVSNSTRYRPYEMDDRYLPVKNSMLLDKEGYIVYEKAIYHRDERNNITNTDYFYKGHPTYQMLDYPWSLVDANIRKVKSQIVDFWNWNFTTTNSNEYEEIIGKPIPRRDWDPPLKMAEMHISKVDFTYEFDPQGNWTKCIVVHNGLPYKVINREIEYR